MVHYLDDRNLTSETLFMEEQLHFNILTRTSKRPHYFAALCKSIDAQDYTNWTHHVITDDQNSVTYITELGREPKVTPRLEKRTDINHHFPYNLYINELYDEVSEGYVLIIDDDDCFLTPQALTFLANTIQTTGGLPTLFWRVKFPDGFIPRETDNFIFRPTNVTTCGYCFHTKFIDAAEWDEFKESDFRVAHKIKLASNTALYLKNAVLTGFGLQRGLAAGGRGLRDDIEMAKPEKAVTA